MAKVVCVYINNSLFNTIEKQLGMVYLASNKFKGKKKVHRQI